MPTRAQPPAVPRLTYLRIKNYRTLRDVEFRDLTPLTVLIGPNGSGKSTVLDALDFLAEAVSGDLRKAWEARNRFAGMRTRGSEGNITFELEFLFNSKKQKYTIEFYELDQIEFPQILINHERFEQVSPVIQLSFEGLGQLEDVDRDGIPRWLKGKYLQKNGQLKEMSMSSYYAFIGSMGGFRGYENHPLTIAADYIRSYIINYRYIHLTDNHLKGESDKGPRERLSPNGDNLPNVLYYLHTKHPVILARITAQMRQWVPKMADIVPEITSDERILLRFKDAEFEKPLPAQYMSAGTMRLAALLTLLYEPGATGLLGLEEPENELHPRLLPQLAEELVKATETRQLLVATHSPALLNALEPEQVWIMHRAADGYAQVTRAADIPNVKELVEDGSPLGYLWTSNSLTVGDPLAPRPAADAR